MVANCIELRKNPEGVNILTALMEDKNEVVRHRATFGLGNHDTVEDGVRRLTDSPEIRPRFRRRLEIPTKKHGAKRFGALLCVTILLRNFC